jgi:nitroreductase/NAD-dependent dihydropyrimidine dehydrogenase PreA subunit
MAWEDVQDILRPKSVHMGKMEVDEEACSGCGLCVSNCVTKAWEMGDDDVPYLKEGYSCVSCCNCMVACSEEAISIVEPYHVDDGFWKTIPHPLPVRPPLEPKDEEGNPTEYTTVERAVLERRSVRNYKDKQVPDTLIRRVLEAGRFAPSSGNCQPWKFVVVKDRAMIDEMDEIIMQVVDGVHSTYMNDETEKAREGLVADNPTPPADPRMMIGGFGAVARREMKPSLGAPMAIIMGGDPRAIGGPQLQLAICGQNMSLVANSLGIRSCWVGFYCFLEQYPDIKKKLGLEPPWTIISGMVLGYPKFNQDGMVPREYRPVTWFRTGWDHPEIET